MADEFAVKGLHVSTSARGDRELWDRFIREALPAEGVNLLVMEINYGYQYESCPQVCGEDGLSAAEVKRLVAACADVGVELVPQINAFGHQSWGGKSGGLLRAFPEFDERPDIPQEAGQETLYCRSWCPLIPEVHDVFLPIVDEMADVCGAKQFHFGMDEVFLIAEEKCPRCNGKDPAELFAGEVTKLHDHLAAAGRTMWMWADRFIDSEEFATGKWEGAANGTAPSVDMVAKDIVMCDWHYERAFDTPQYFAAKGFPVLACPWQKQDVALDELAIMRDLRKETDLALGMLQTTWCGFDRFAQAYFGELDPEEKRSKSAIGAAECFKALFAEMRG